MTGSYTVADPDGRIRTVIVFSMVGIVAENDSSEKMILLNMDKDDKETGPNAPPGDLHRRWQRLQG